MFRHQFYVIRTGGLQGAFFARGNFLKKIFKKAPFFSINLDFDPIKIFRIPPFFHKNFFKVPKRCGWGINELLTTFKDQLFLHKKYQKFRFFTRLFKKSWKRASHIPLVGLKFFFKGALYTSHIVLKYEEILSSQFYSRDLSSSPIRKNGTKRVKNGQNRPYNTKFSPFKTFILRLFVFF